MQRFTNTAKRKHLQSRTGCWLALSNISGAKENKTPFSTNIGTETLNDVSVTLAFKKSDCVGGKL